MTQNNYIPRTRDDFWLDGVSGSSMGLAVEIPPVPPLAVQQYTQYRYGGDTMGFAPDNEFDPLTITVVGRVFRKADNFDNTALYAWLQGKKILKLSRFPGYHYRIRRVLGITPKLSAKGNEITYQIQFVCDPWKYADDNSEFVLPDGGIVVNSYTRYSKPIIKFSMTPQTASITTNGETLSITDGGGSTLVTIDSNRMLVYKTVNSQNISIMDHTVGKLPMLAVGNNVIQVSENVSSVTIIGNWRCY